MTTLYQFTPTIDQNFTFTPTLDGSQYACEVVWGLFGQRWILNVYTLQNALVVTKPFVPSPDNYDIDLVEGYFSSSLVFRESSNNIEVSP